MYRVPNSGALGQEILGSAPGTGVLALASPAFPAVRTGSASLAFSPGRHAQGYFQYEALKSGGVTISSPRFVASPIKSDYLIRSDGGYLATHKEEYMFTIKARLILRACREGGTLGLNVP